MSLLPKMLGKSLHIGSLLTFLAAALLLPSQVKAQTSWKIKSVDTQIVSKCWNNVPQSSIDTQVRLLKDLGVNYIAVGTPYDRPDEMAKWVNSIHNAGLNVWFRSHWLNWEGDEGQAKNMTPSQYLAKTKQFILDHPELFKEGDSFTMSVEAENAGVGPGQAFSNWGEYNWFLSQEIDLSNQAFSQIGLAGKVATNWLSMNGWIVENALDPAVVSKMGLLTVDHYPEQGSGNSLTPPSQLASDMSRDLDRFYAKWQVPIMIGEWGYHIHQDVSDEQQKQATEAVFQVLQSKSYIYGVNYWDHMGNNTRIINDSGGTPTTLRPAAEVIAKYFLTSSTEPTNPPSTETPTNTTDQKVISDFENGMAGWNSGTLVPGFSSSKALRLANPANGSGEAKKSLTDFSFKGYSRLELDINLNGNRLLPGDASALYFDQGGWKWISLEKYVQNQKDGWQHVSIPLSDLKVQTDQGAASIGLRFWNYQSVSYDIDNIKLTNQTTSPEPGTPNPPPATPPPSTEPTVPLSGYLIADFTNTLSGFTGGQLSNNALLLSNPANGAAEARKLINSPVAKGYSRLELDINLNGNRLLPGDASALYFDQGGWKWISLEKYVQNQKDGWQHVSIPLSDFPGLNTNAGIATMGLRVWNYPSTSLLVDNIYLVK